MQVLVITFVAAGFFLFAGHSHAIPFVSWGSGNSTEANGTLADELPVQYSMKQQLALRGIKLSMKASAKMVKVAAGMVSKALEIIDKIIPSPPPSKFDSWTNITNPLSSFFGSKSDAAKDEADDGKPIKDAETDGILAQYMPSFFG